ncbi:hypothetical protein [Streptomyces griseus]|uniref:electron transfer flavoprotein subunit beta/FixA family protein n=1 Tax=Streptomyces griseus TaxID=1911 RepID=UPI001F459D20|nr:hypothetical protein [Streptomyces griseus]
MGADSGVHVLDDAIAGSDCIATSLVLAKAIGQIKAESGVDLVLCGMASTAASGSVVPAMLAERLGVPQVTLASAVESQGDQVRITRGNEGSTEVIGATLPIVLSVTDRSGEARYPSFKGRWRRRRSRCRPGRCPTPVSTSARSACPWRGRRWRILRPLPSGRVRCSR